MGPVSGGGFRLAMILVLFTYGGWNEMAYVAAEIRNPAKNILRSLVLGTVAVTVLYLLINGAFMHALGYGGLAASEAAAADAVGKILPGQAAKIISLIICISALGAVNGLVFTGARISYALGTGHALFRKLGRWHPALGTPVAALALQGALSLAIVVLAGSFIDAILYYAPAVWLFFLLTGLSLYRLRRKEPDRARPCLVAGYPVVPFIFCAACLFMLYSCITYAWAEKPAGLLILCGTLLAGLLISRFSRSSSSCAS